MIICKFEDNNTAHLRHVTVNAVAVKNNKILLVKRAKHLSNAGLYALPGGFLGRDETTQECALRELKEETGYTGKIRSLLWVNDNPNRPKEDRQNVDFIYVVDVGEKIAEPDEESQSVTWFEMSDLPSEEQYAFDHYESIRMFVNNKTQTS